MKKLISLTLLIALLSLTVSSCRKDKGKPPVLPHYESMIIDFGAFLGGSKGGQQFDGSKDVPDPDENYSFAASVVNIWKLEIGDRLIVPLTAFKQASGNIPVWVADKTWEWKFNVTGVPGTYKARIRGKILSNEVRWEAYIKREGSGATPEFLWFEGRSDADAGSAKWTIKHSYEFPEVLLETEWTKTDQAISPVKYTYARSLRDDRSPDPFKGSTLQYHGSQTPYNAGYTIHIFEPVILSDFVDVDIEWSTAAGNGRVRAVHKFGDNDWHCWDSEKNNITCP